MPWGWIVFTAPTASGAGGGASTSSNPGLPTDPEELEKFVRDVVENAGAEFYGLYYDVGGPRCYVLVKSLDKYEKAKAVTDILHASSYTKLLDPKQAKGARRLEQRFRKPRARPMKPKPPPKKP